MKKLPKIPKSLDEAVSMIVNNLEPKDIDYIKKESPDSVHFTFGMWLRNNLGLWKENSLLKKDIKKRFNLFAHADDCSGLILTGIWATVNREDINQALERQAQSYSRHWIREGINPNTGKTLPKIKIIKYEKNR